MPSSKRARNASAERAESRPDTPGAAKHKGGATGASEADRVGGAGVGPPAYVERAAAARAEDERRSKLKVHLARFVEYRPQIVTAMAYEAETQMLAVARGSGDIELWRTAAPRWHAVGTLTGSSSSQIRSVCWARRDGEPPRLFSGSLDGAITEWSLHSLGPVSVTDSQGGSVWCLALSHSGERLAAACHDGGVRIFEASEKVPGLASSDGVVFRQLLPRHPGEALSVAWGPGDGVLVTGDSHGVVRVWQLGKERSGVPPTVQTISVASNTGAGGLKKAALLWAVAAHADMTVWAADSKGNTHVIDGRMGLVVKRFVAHHGSDVLALATHGLNDCFSAGVDGRVVHYRRVSGASGAAQAGAQWVQAGAARLHTHDIRCLCLAGQFYSVGGTDKKAAEYESGKRVLKPDACASRVEALNLERLHHCLVSAGLDTQLCLYTYDLPQGSSGGQGLRPAMRLPPWPLQSCVSVSAPLVQQVGEEKTSEVRMLAWHSQSMEVWRWKVTSRGRVPPHAAHLPGGQAVAADKDREWVEERRINMWKVKFALDDEQVDQLRKSFEQVLDAEKTDTRAVPKQAMKRVIETTQVLVDSVDVGNDGRPAVTQDELENYVAALGPLWAETCEQDAVEVANGECLVPLDTENFDLSECMAIFGMCLREHCGTLRAVSLHTQAQPPRVCLCMRTFLDVGKRAALSAREGASVQSARWAGVRLAPTIMSALCVCTPTDARTDAHRCVFAYANNYHIIFMCVCV